MAADRAELSRRRRRLQRKVAYLFSYRNGIRERSVGILRRYGTEEQPEVVLELYGEAERKKAWRIYYFNRYEGLAEATFLWELTTEHSRSERQIRQCRLCAEAGVGNGILLLPEHVAAERTERIDWPDTREYLCARYDGKEVTERELRAALKRKPTAEAEENRCMQSAKRLMEEITKAAAGEAAAGEQAREVCAPKKQGVSVTLRKRAEHNRIACLEELLRTRPSYEPCREKNVGYSVRITPEDLLLLPKEGRYYTENSYLLHGYYRYRHVLLGRRIGKEREDYVLLVPGRYDKKEADLAELFGFPEFLPVLPETGIAASGKGLFGYWCGKI